MNEGYFCCACGEHSIEINPDWVAEAESKGLEFVYVYCRNPHVRALHHSDDVIANTIYHTAKLAGENAATGTLN